MSDEAAASPSQTTHRPTLATLLGAAGDAHDDLLLTGLTADSRAVAPGFLFVAIPGTQADGARFIPDAVARGARAVAGEGERPAALSSDIAYRRVGDARRTLALAAGRFYPEQPRDIVAVTGTAGKSSVADFVRQIHAHLGERAASIGTLGVVTSDGAAYGSLTTPDPTALHRTLSEIARSGIAHVALEASSHGIDQRRLDAVRISAAAFTNLGRDHLDYHPTMEDYLAAKMRLFEALLPEGKPAIVNADGDYAERAIAVVRATNHPLITVGIKGETIRLVSNETTGFTQGLVIEHEGRRYQVAFPLIGAFQVENALVAAALVIATGGVPEKVFEALAHLEGVSGRLERVGEVNGALCIVDYAHKPDALAHVLDALRPYATGDLVCLVGCGGDRDPGKRPIMGRIAIEKSDRVIVTDDNPRSEDPAAIRAQILASAPGAQEIGDRAVAIREAVRSLKAGDVLVVAGKGHETGQIVGDRTLPFSDHEAVRAAIAEIRGETKA
jgi:UDP-N-acetylmuramoyl-L-alanyl-D-glutamate--2,6-diaminopimelate ligase